MKDLRIGPPQLSGGKVFWPVQEYITTSYVPDWTTVDFFPTKMLAEACIKVSKL